MVERIKERVKKGGHPIAEKDIVRRYYRSTRNFWRTYRPFADKWIIINNNDRHFRDIVLGEKVTFDVRDSREFEKFKETLDYEKKR
ncbi:MAG: hypothetical protein MJA29_08310 [Candidatus Omnitrophica bacterium]|nr:hypothetical protein [Candidatus Omnitrophota bacterium]